MIAAELGKLITQLPNHFIEVFVCGNTPFEVDGTAFSSSGNQSVAEARWVISRKKKQGNLNQLLEAIEWH